MKESMSSSYHPLLARPENYGTDTTLLTHLGFVSKSSFEIFDQSANNVEGLPFDLNSLCKLAEIMGACHDAAKCTSYFQEYIRSDGKRNLGQLKAHSPLSALYTFKVATEILPNDPSSSILAAYGALAVLAHHGRFDSPVRSETKLRSFCKEYVERQVNSVNKDSRDELDVFYEKLGYPKFSTLLNQWKPTLKDFRNAISYILKRENSTPSISNYFAINLLFSSLIDADRFHAAELKIPQRVTLKVDRVLSYVNQISKEAELAPEVSPKTREIRNKLFSMLRSKAESCETKPSIYSITAPTGAGKTLAALYFALKLRERMRGDTSREPRIIYVAPFLSILDQNFQVIQKAIGNPPQQSNLILLHHHLCELSYNIDSQSFEKESFSTSQSELLIEGWNSEIVVTTAIQFFYTILGRSASELRKFHNLTNSIVILDEVQNLQERYWGLIRSALLYLNKFFKMTFILMTATQPLIFKEGEIIELVDDYESLFISPNSYLEKNLLPMSLEDFITQFKQLVTSRPQNSILVIMNTIDAARQLYERSSNLNRQFEYLSAEVIPKERKIRIQRIKDLLKRKEPLVVISTQLIEAGIDFDFDIVLRDMAPCDSLIQSAGRCNRNGTKMTLESPTYVFQLDNNGLLCRRIYGNFLIEKSLEALAEWDGRGSIETLAKSYYRLVNTGRSTVTEDRILSGIGSLNYESLDEFQPIEELPKISVFVEVDQEAQDIWKEYLDTWNDRSGKEAREKYLKLRASLNDYIINVQEGYALALPQNYGFRYVSHDNLRYQYDTVTGFLRNPPSIL
jgi:CRISPR-associated endonuclease/helicase Cas3